MKDDLAFLILQMALILADCEPISGSEECRYDGPHVQYMMAGKNFHVNESKLRQMLKDVLAALSPFLPSNKRYQFGEVQLSRYRLRGGKDAVYVTICL